MKTQFLPLLMFCCAVVFAVEIPAPKIDIPLNGGNIAAIKNIAAPDAPVKVYNQNVLKWTDGPEDKALVFTNPEGDQGDHCMLSAALPPGMDMKTFTFCMRVKSPDPMKQNRWFEAVNFWEGKCGFQFYLAWEAFRISTGDGQKVDGIVAPPGTIPPCKPGTWYWVGVTFDGERLKLYQDGALIATMENTPYKPVNRGTLYIGSGGPAGVVHFFEGAITGFKVFDTALDAAQMAELSQR